MSDDWEAEYWKRKKKQLANKQNQPAPDDPSNYTRMPQGNPEDLPHFDPNDLYKQMAQQGQPQQSPDGWKDVDPMASLMGRQMAAQGPQTKPCTLREGAIHYRPVDAQNFGTTMPLAKNCGPLSQVQGKEFELGNETNVYIIDGMNVVDMEHVDPSRTKQLVEVSAPFTGKILVEKSAIIGIQGGGGPQMLKD